MLYWKKKYVELLLMSNLYHWHGQALMWSWSYETWLAALVKNTKGNLSLGMPFRTSCGSLVAYDCCIISWSRTSLLSIHFSVLLNHKCLPNVVIWCLPDNDRCLISFHRNSTQMSRNHMVIVNVISGKLHIRSCSGNSRLLYFCNQQKPLGFHC